MLWIPFGNVKEGRIQEFQTWTSRDGRATPPSVIEDEALTTDSFRKLASMEVACLLPGHGTRIRR